MGYSFRLAASSHRQDNTYHGLCYTSRGALARMRNSSMGPPHEGSIHERMLLPRSYISLLTDLAAKDLFICNIHKTDFFILTRDTIRYYHGSNLTVARSPWGQKTHTKVVKWHEKLGIYFY